MARHFAADGLWLPQKVYIHLLSIFRGDLSLKKVNMCTLSYHLESMFLSMMYVVKARPKSLHTMQIERTDIQFTCDFYEVFFLSVAIHQKQL